MSRPYATRGYGEFDPFEQADQKNQTSTPKEPEQSAPEQTSPAHPSAQDQGTSDQDVLKRVEAEYDRAEAEVKDAPTVPLVSERAWGPTQKYMTEEEAYRDFPPKGRKGGEPGEGSSL
ncbi:hypothetical protein HK102_002884 [Quaeritorhiza haematococci]|nr:hypothetical protein HK102_002884 [Quaeritorhiza haematococci]